MKKKLIVLGIGVLLGSGLYAGKLASISVNSINEITELFDEPDFSDLEFKVIKASALPETISKLVKELEELGNELEEAAVAETTEGQEVYRLFLVGFWETTKLYLNKDAEILGKEVVKIEQVPEEEIEE